MLSPLPVARAADEAGDHQRRQKLLAVFAQQVAPLLRLGRVVERDARDGCAVTGRRRQPLDADARRELGVAPRALEKLLDVDLAGVVVIGVREDGVDNLRDLRGVELELRRAHLPGDDLRQLAMVDVPAAVLVVEAEEEVEALFRRAEAQPHHRVDVLVARDEAGAVGVDHAEQEPREAVVSEFLLRRLGRLGRLEHLGELAEVELAVVAGYLVEVRLEGRRVLVDGPARRHVREVRLPGQPRRRDSRRAAPMRPLCNRAPSTAPRRFRRRRAHRRAPHLTRHRRRNYRGSRRLVAGKGGGDAGNSQLGRSARTVDVHLVELAGRHFRGAVGRGPLHAERRSVAGVSKLRKVSYKKDRAHTSRDKPIITDPLS